MSLKVFHIVFVIASVGLALWLAVWALGAYAAEGGSLNLAMGLSACVAGVGLVFYGAAFWRKLKHVGVL